MAGIFADEPYRSKSSSANHNSTGSEAPSKSTTTCLKFASANCPCIGIAIRSPTARTVPRSFAAPKVIVTGSPSCTGLGISLGSVIGGVAYRIQIDSATHPGNLVLGEACVAGGQLEDLAVLDEDMRGRAKCAEDELLTTLTEVVEAALPNLFGAPGENPMWCENSGPRR